MINFDDVSDEGIKPVVKPSKAVAASPKNASVISDYDDLDFAPPVAKPVTRPIERMVVPEGPKVPVAPVPVPVVEPAPRMETLGDVAVASAQPEKSQDLVEPVVLPVPVVSPPALPIGPVEHESSRTLQDPTSELPKSTTDAEALAIAKAVTSPTAEPFEIEAIPAVVHTLSVERDSTILPKEPTDVPSTDVSPTVRSSPQDPRFWLKAGVAGGAVAVILALGAVLVHRMHQHTAAVSVPVPTAVPQAKTIVAPSVAASSVTSKVPASVAPSPTIASSPVGVSTPSVSNADAQPDMPSPAEAAAAENIPASLASPITPSSAPLMVQPVVPVRPSSHTMPRTSPSLAQQRAREQAKLDAINADLDRRLNQQAH